MLPFIIPLLFLFFPPPGNATSAVCFSTRHGGAPHADLYKVARSQVSAACPYAVVIDEESRKVAFWRAGGVYAREDCLVSRVRSILDKWHDARFVTSRAREKLTRDVMDNIIGECSHRQESRSPSDGRVYLQHELIRATNIYIIPVVFILILGIIFAFILITPPRTNDRRQFNETPSAPSDISSDDSDYSDDSSSSDDSDSD